MNQYAGSTIIIVHKPDSPIYSNDPACPHVERKKERERKGILYLLSKAKKSVSRTNRVRGSCARATTENRKQCSAPSLAAKDRQEAWYPFHVMLGVTFARVWYIATHKQ